MNYWFVFISLLIGCVICAPLFKYLIKSFSANGSEFNKGYHKVKNRNAMDDFINGVGSNDYIVNNFAYANIVALLLPLVPASIIAIPFYFLLEWLYQHAI